MSTRRERLIYPLGVMWIARGALTLLVPEMPDAALPHQMIAVTIRSGLWIATGLAAMILAAVRHNHAIPILIIMPAAMAASYVLDAFATLTPPNPPGSWAAFPQLAYWAGLVWLLWGLSGLRITRPDDTEDAPHVGGAAA
ncbi:MAG: hypothetical protein WAX29_09245 [Propionibacterium sp.]